MAAALPGRAAFLLLLLAAVLLADAARQPQDGVLAVDKKKHKHPYTAPTGMFIQVRDTRPQQSTALQRVTLSRLALTTHLHTFCVSTGARLQAAARRRPALQLWRPEALGGRAAVPGRQEE
jgi:hypothetical protein